MPKRLIKKITPDHDTVRSHKHLQIFGTLLHDPNLFHMNRRSISGAFAVGLFWAMIPIPLQMVAAAATAIVVRVNLPLSIALVWLTNPITMPPIFYINYLAGTWLLNTPKMENDFEVSMEWFAASMNQIWQPLYFGSVISGILLGTLGYVAMRLLWRLHIITRFKERRARAKQQRTAQS
ncbi:MAG: DUF2062 domain-containing protein [Gammaproteobacteria bacterium]|nr:DUF2062 domain-containing protein [Gammaproteobacteria bacterium]